MAKRVLVPIADGTEELEAVAIIDILRRAGAAVTAASVDGGIIRASKGLRLCADSLIKDVTDHDFDLIALPGGMPGSERLRDAPALIAMLERQQREGRLFGAICAAPAVTLHPHHLLDGRSFTCHPDFSHIAAGKGFSDEPVVVDGNLVTSRGAGTAVLFALTLVGKLFNNEELRREVERGMAIPTARP
jgi:protein deglycase